MTTRRFEGPDLATVLEEVHAELGEGARVVAANRCRTGGVAGFFAKETFEVFVELEAVQAPRAVPRGVGAPAATRARQAAVMAPAMSPAMAPAMAPAMSPHLATLEDLMAAADRVDGPAPAAPATRGGAAAGVSASRYARFDDALEHASAEEFGPLDDVIAYDGDEAFDEWGDDGDEGRGRAGRRAAKHRRWRRRQSGSPMRHAPADGSVDRSIADAAAVADAAALAGAAGARGARVIDLRGIEHDPHDSHGAGGGGGYAPSSPLPPAALGDPGLDIRPEFPDRAEPSMRPGTVSVEALAALGVPRSWMPPRLDAHVRVEDALANLLTPPDIPLARGAVLVFVGQGESLVSAARGLALALRLDPDDCVVVGPDGTNVSAPCIHVRTVDELSLLAPAWALSDGVTIVAIDAGFALQDLAWCRQALSLLRPVLRWGVVDATRKPEDIRAWARGIGGLHALAVSGVSQTVTPAAILAAEIPVARLDGRIASRALWTKLLDERIHDPGRRRLPDLVRS